MSSLLVEVIKIEKIEKHPNGERLELAFIKGWSCVVGKGQFKTGDKAIYFPVDTLLSKELADKMGVTKYLSGWGSGDGYGRIRAAKLRGYISYGLLVPCEDSSWEVGKNVANHYKVKKYEPPLNLQTEWPADIDHPRFHKYTDIENHKNFPGILQDGEEVICTEKIHGTCSRSGYIDGKFMAGSFSTRYKKQVWVPKLLAKLLFKLFKWKQKDNLYWFPLKDEKVQTLLKHLGNNTVVFGEIYGLQHLKYGMQPGVVAYRVFDIAKEGRHMDWDDFKTVCDKFSVQTAPVLYKGPYSFERINEVAQGRSTIENADCIREGTVVKPVKERWNERTGRTILKHLSDEYELGQDRTDSH